MIRIAVLVSGNGSNLQAILDAHISGTIVGVLSNQANAFALQRAKQAGIASAVISHKDYPTRDSFDAQMHAQLLKWKVDLVVLAGFMRILSSDFVQQWEGRMLNIHPSLLPYYKGMHTHRRVLNTGDVFHGCTVHFVTAQLDSGQAIAQAILQVNLADDEQSLAQRVHHLEHRLYPQVIEWYCTQTLVYQNAEILLNNKPLNKPLQLSFFDL